MAAKLFDCEDLIKRVGLLYITFDALDGSPASHEIMGSIYTRIVPMHTQFDWGAKMMIIRALSPEFEVRDPSLAVPRYNVLVERKQDHVRYFHTISFEKVSNAAPKSPLEFA